MTVVLESFFAVPSERNELIQFLNFIAAEWHRDEEAFEQRSLADWPQWCEDQGFRFELLETLVLKLESTSQASANSPNIGQHIASLGANATVLQLLDRIGEHSPQLLQSFEELMEISAADADALNTVAGGTAKEWVKDHPGVDAAVGIISLGAIGTYVTHKIRQAAERERREAAAAERDAWHEIEVEAPDMESELQMRLWQRLKQKDADGREGVFASSVKKDLNSKIDKDIEEEFELPLKEGEGFMKSRAGAVVDGVANQAEARAKSALEHEEERLISAIDEAADNLVKKQLSDAEQSAVDKVVGED